MGGVDGGLVGGAGAIRVALLSEQQPEGDCCRWGVVGVGSVDGGLVGDAGAVRVALLYEQPSEGYCAEGAMSGWAASMAVW